MSKDVTAIDADGFRVVVMGKRTYLTHADGEDEEEEFTDWDDHTLDLNDYEAQQDLSQGVCT